MVFKTSLRNPKGDITHVRGFMILEGTKLWVSPLDFSLRKP
jgi:hypothetical protein